MKPIIVIPTYNERENIVGLLSALFALDIPELEVIVVDDNSPDGTAQAVREYSAAHRVHLVCRNKKLGLGSAYIAGMKKALHLGADAVFEMDADFSHNPADVPRMLAKLAKTDMVVGSRRVSGGRIVGWNVRRHLTSRTANLFSRLVLRLKTRDVTAGFRCYRREVLQSIQFETVKSNGYAFQEELLCRVERAGFIVSEIPVVFTDRKAGKSKLSARDIAEFFLVMARLAMSRQKFSA